MRLNSYQEEKFKQISISIFEGTRVFENNFYKVASKFNFSTLWDVVSSLSENRSVSIIKTSLLNDPQGYIDWYTYMTGDNILPKTLRGDETIVEMVKKFIEEYCELTDKLTHLPWNRHSGTEIKMITNPAKCLKKRYIYGYDWDTVGREIGKDKETAKNITYYLTKPASFLSLFRARMENPSEHLKERVLYKIHPIFLGKLNIVGEFVKHSASIEELNEIIGYKGCEDDPMRDFAIDLYGYRIFDATDRRLKNKFLVKVDSKHLKDIWKSVFEKLEKEVKPYPKALFETNILRKKLKINNQQIIDAIHSIVRSSDKFIVFKQDGEEFYQVSWSALGSLDAKALRLLYEHRGERLSRQELLRLYNIEAHKYGDEELDESVFIIHASDKFTTTKTGYRYWNDGITIQERSCLDYVKSYAAEHKRFFLDDIIDYVKDRIPEVNEDTLKTELNMVCHSVASRRNSSSEYVYSEYITEFADVEYSVSRDLTKEIVNLFNGNSAYSYRDIQNMFFEKYRYRITYQKVRNTCNNNVVFSIIHGESRRSGCLVIINPEWNKEIDNEDRHRQEKKYKQKIRTHAIELLKYVEGNRMPLKELIKAVEFYFPNDLKKPNIYKIFDDQNIFIKEQVGSARYISLNRNKYVAEHKEAKYAYKDIDKNIPELYVMDMSKDMNSLYDAIELHVFGTFNTVLEGAQCADLRISFDNMLKIMSLYGSIPAKSSQFARILSELFIYYYGKTSHYEVYHLRDDIQLSYESFLNNLLKLKGIVYQNQKNEGLATLINKLQNKGMLPKRDVSSRVSRIITKIIWERNDKSHTGGDTLPYNKVVEQIDEFISLYLYTAYMNKVI